MPHNIGGTVSKADLQAAENSFATASNAYETAETNYNNAEANFFTLESDLITADGELFEAEDNLFKLQSAGAEEELLDEAQSNLDEAQDNRDTAFLAFRAKDIVVRQSESLFFKAERTYFDEQDHLFQVQDQFNFQVSELRESAGVRSGISNNFDQYLFTGRDSATDATNRENAQTQLTNQNSKLSTQELELDGFNRALSYVSQDFEEIWIRLGRIEAPPFDLELTARANKLTNGQEEIDTPVNAALKSVKEIWVSKTGAIGLWNVYSLNFDIFTTNSNILKNNPGAIRELDSNLSSLEAEKEKIEARIVELGGPFKKGAKIPEEAVPLQARLAQIDGPGGEIQGIKEQIEKLDEELTNAQTLFNKHGADFGTGYVAHLQSYQKKVREVEELIDSIGNSVNLKEEAIATTRSQILSTEVEIEQYEAILRPKEDALAITEIFVEQIAGAITAGGDSETKVIRSAKVKGQKAGENITAADALALARSFNWSMKQIKGKVTEAAEKGETSIIVDALSPATVSVLNDMGYNMRLIGVETTIQKVDNAGGRGVYTDTAVDQKIEISWLFARDASIEDYSE
jgi:hypothetical protein